MIGPEYFTVAAYVTDMGMIICRRCGEYAKLPASDQITFAQLTELSGAPGAWCDDCCEEIIAPYIEDRSEEN